jgi:hypothetical protein
MREISDKLIRNDNAINPHTLSLNIIQTTTSRKIFFDLDIDFKRKTIRSLLTNSKRYGRLSQYGLP